MLDDRHGGRHILQRLFGLQLLHVAAPLVAPGIVVAELYAPANPVEQCGRDRGVALRREAVGDRADVAVDAEDLLQHHDRAPRAAGGAAR